MKGGEYWNDFLQESTVPVTNLNILELSKFKGTVSNMSTPIWARIKIFGDVPKSLLEELYDHIREEFRYSSGDFEEKKPEQFLSNWFKITAGKNKVLDFSDANASSGVFGNLEPFLEQNNISYIRESAGDGGECNPEVIYFDGRTKIELETNSDNNPILPVQTVVRLCTTAMELEEEIKKGNAPLYVTEKIDTAQSVMAKYALSKPYTPTGAELIKAYIESQYPAIPNELPPFKVVKG